MNGNDSALFSKASDEWSTPAKLFEMLDKEFHFDFDGACTRENCLCTHGAFVGEFDPLSWTPTWNRVWLNPPYSKIGAFMKKAYEESLKGAIVVCLIPSRTDTKYFHDYCMKAHEIRFIKGRLKFSDGKGSAPFPSCIVIFKNKSVIEQLENPYYPVMTGMETPK